MKKRIVLLSIIVFVGAFLTLTVSARQEELEEKATIIFSGFPQVKISEGGCKRVPERLSDEKAAKFTCIISQKGDEYYWTTRENIQMVAVKSGAYTTYIAIAGAGYIRVIDPEIKKVSSAILDETEKQFDYVEHMPIGLKAVTYYGKSM